MHTYKMNYTTKTTEGEATLTLDHMATHLQIVEAAARHCHPGKKQEIGNVFDKEVYAGTDYAGADHAGADHAGADHAGSEDYFMLMAECGILTLSYTIDDELEEHNL